MTTPKQNPGIHKKVVIPTTTNHSLRRIISNLSNIFFINHVKVDDHDTKKTIVYMKPTTELEAKFNFTNQRDILCIISDHEFFDGRVLDKFDQIIARNENRLDKLCGFVISRDPNVSRKVDDLSKSSTENKIIIPLPYEKVLSHSEAKENCESALKSYLYTRDLFAFDSPLQTENYFFGRKEDIQSLYGKYTNNENGCIFGLRRIGKTSVLLALKRNVEARQIPAIYIDCSKPDYHQTSWNNTLFKIKERIVDSIGLTDKITSKQSDYSKESAAGQFHKDLIGIKKQKGGKRILLMLDEVRSLTFDISHSSIWRHTEDPINFWYTLRSIFQEDPSLLCIIIADVNPYLLERAKTKNGIDNPFYYFTTPNYIKFFSDSDVQVMTSGIGAYAGLRFDPSVSSDLSRDYGGHPFLIRQACSQIFNITKSMPKPLAINRYFYEKNKSDILIKVKSYVNQALEILKTQYSEEYELLEYLAAGDESSFNKFANENIEWIQHLLGYGLLIKEQDSYHFTMQATKEVVNENRKTIIVPGSKEERWVSVCEQRNNFEHRLKKIIKTAIKLKHGSNASTEIKLCVNKQSQKDKIDSLGYAAIFDNEFYLMDSKKAVERNWEIFSSIFKDKALFSSRVEKINKARKDAHANEINEFDCAAALESLQLLNSAIDEFEN
ncbi:hypothetical protein J9978_09610 [Chromobacterium violaceum]|nr:hypothetical protein [Chromobacterium violaceum]MBP4049755.1 hypothetical protein [Chromobacterium violaceum]